MAQQRGVDLFEHSDRARQLRDRRARPGHVAATVVRRGQASARRHRRPADGVDAQQRDRRTDQVVRGACLTGISAQVGGRDMTNEIGINQLKRRDFLRAGLVFGAGAAGLAAGYAAVPDAFARAVYAAKQEGITNEKVLVMIQLAGGNDGLRTLVPLADPTLRDLQATMTVIREQKPFGFTGGREVGAAVGALYKGTPGIYGALFDTAIATATETVATLRTSAASYQPMADYSDKVKLVYSSKNQLAAALQLAAELIVTGTGVKLLHVTLGGFDTHYTELSRHDDLMAYLDSAVSAFYQDLSAHNMADKVLIATWSEFGRRPRENASGGTDHGPAAPLLLIGDPVTGGLYGAEPSLTTLDNTGNLKYSVDFRSVYQEILSGHLGADAAKILGSSYDRVPFLKAPVAV